MKISNVIIEGVAFRIGSNFPASYSPGCIGIVLYIIIEIWSNKGKTANKENFKGKIS